jgi:hypothetical protein
MIRLFQSRALNLFLLINLSILAGCDARTSLRGTVTDSDDRPIAGAVLKMEAAKGNRVVETRSGVNGSFEIGITHGPFSEPFSLLVYKQGFTAFSQNLKANTQQTTKIVLQMSPNDWQVIRTISDGSGGRLHLVVIPEAHQKDQMYYKQIGDALCEKKSQCSVDYWTDVTHIPRSAWIPVKDLAVMTGYYSWYPTYSEPSIHLSCWLYPSKKIGESEKCCYEPGAPVPPDI